MSKPFHPDEMRNGASPIAPAAIGHNRPPLGEEVVADFLAAARDHDGVDLIKRLEEIEVAEGKLGDCADKDAAGRYADFCKQAKAATDALEAVRMAHNRPLLDAQKALKGRADSLAEKVAGAALKARNALDRFLNAERLREAEERRQAEQLAREETARHEARAREQAEAGIPVEVAPVVQISVAKVAPAKVTGDLGAKVTATTTWKHKIKSVRQLPDSILTHSKVVEAIDKVVAQQVRGGVREMKGVEIFPETSSQIR